MSIMSPQAAAPSREFRFTDRDFTILVQLVRERSGIVLGRNKKELVYSRLARRLRALGMPSFAAYRDFLTGPDGQGEITDFVNAITTNLTKFFRESHHFDHLQQCVSQHRGRWEDYRIWSAGCSTGEEPYTIAMVLDDASGGRARGRARILATDLDTKVLAKASEGVYRAASAKDVPVRYRRAYLEAQGREAVSVSPRLRQMISFKRLNLLEGWPLKRAYDAIFCRNVLIYFSAEDKQALVSRYVAQLRPGGYLYLGHSESQLGNLSGLSSVGRTIYRKDAT